MILGVQTERTELTTDFFNSVIFRSQEENFLKNPFRVKAKILMKHFDTLFIMDLEPIYPPVYWLGWILLAVFIIFKLFNFWLVIPGFLIALGFFWSSWFYLLVLRSALRKQGYKGKIKLISKTKIIKELM